MNEIYKVYKTTRQSIWEVSNYGNVKKNGKLYECPLKFGYKMFCGERLHRIIAKLFVSNPDPKNKNVVDHIDTNKLNNHFTNLRWCTQKENCNNQLTRKHNSAAQKIAQYNHTQKKKCVYNNIDFNSIMDAYRYAVKYNSYKKSEKSFYRMIKQTNKIS